jgi:hypothetical protein
MFNVVLFVDSNKTRKSKVKLKRPIRFMNKTSLKTPKGQSENVNQRSDNTMEGQTIQWKDRQYNGRTDNTMEGQTTQWKDRLHNGRTDNTMEGQTIQWKDRLHN